MRYSRYIGIDVQISRGCSYFVLGRYGEKLTSGWVENDIANQLGKIVCGINEKTAGQVAVGIDAPRQPLSEPRKFFWNSKKNKWRNRQESDKGFGRHCEVVVRALGAGNPQWTRPFAESPEWMKLGYEIFKAMPKKVSVFEIFPSASYQLLDDISDVKVSIDFSAFKKGPKDMLDACIGALTVREFVLGRGFEVGGGDEMGTIILPRPPAKNGNCDVLDWPKALEN